MNLLKKSSKAMVFKFLKSLMFGVIVVLIVSISIFAWNLMGYKEVALNNCTEVVKDSTKAFQPVVCEDVGSSNTVMILFFVIVGSLSVIMALIAAFRDEEKYGKVDSLTVVAAFVLSEAMYSVLFLLFLIPSYDFASKISEERSIGSFKEWTTDRYDLDLSDVATKKLYSKRMDEIEDVKPDDETIVESKNGEFLVLVQTKENQYIVVNQKTLDELPLTNAAKK